MTNPAGQFPELTVAVAMMGGVVSQVLAHHLKVPGIVVLIGAGILMGPDVLGLVQPSHLGSALSALVGFAVAIILFEGGLNLTRARLARAGGAIRMLISLGAAITAVGGALSARFVLGWEWPTSILFGTLVIVTGPTVVTPLLRRLKLEKQVSTLLEAEGVLGDAIGAITAVVALEVAINVQAGGSLAAGILQLPLRLGLGSLAGLLGGGAMAWLLRRRSLVPDGMQNIFTLALVVGLFFICDTLLPESGLAAVTVAGVVVANARTGIRVELQEFKEQLTVMLIGLLFLLLAADVRIAEVVALGIPGLLTALALMWVVRPLQVWASTIGSGLSWKQRLFMSWIAPRGIVAAAVSSHFANELSHAGIPGGQELRAMVFLVIVLTVVSAGLTGGPIANLLGLRRGDGQGWVILGANELGRLVAHLLESAGQDVSVVDTNAENCAAAQAEGLRTVNGNALEERILLQTGVESAAAVVGLLPNERVNLQFAEAARVVNKDLRGLIGLNIVADIVTPELAAARGMEILFGRSRDMDRWIIGLRSGGLHVETWGPGPETSVAVGQLPDTVLPLLWQRGTIVSPATTAQTLQAGDKLILLMADNAQSTAHRWLLDRGWVSIEESFATNAVTRLKAAQNSSELML